VTGILSCAPSMASKAHASNVAWLDMHVSDRIMATQAYCLVPTEASKDNDIVLLAHSGHTYQNLFG
jgi:hypothetical protein